MDLPDDLITLETVAETERARLTGLSGAEWEEQRLRWREAAERVQAAITKHAKATGENRFAVEAAVKKAVRHAE